MKRKPLFWWVVKSPRGYLDTTVEDGTWWPTRGIAEPFRSLSGAKHARDEWAPRDGRVVLVHARIPEPKLPDWMCRTALGPRMFAVFAIAPTRVTEHIFEVTDGGAVRPISRVTHTANGAETWGPADVWKPEVLAEAAARAAKIVRAEKRAKAAGAR